MDTLGASGDPGAIAAQTVIDLLGLEPLAVEGGMFKETWRDAAGSAIYFLVRRGDFSAMHRLTVPELWHHYAGAGVSMLLLDPNGSIEEPQLGVDLEAGERPFVAVPAGIWMGAETTGEWSLLGTTMAPPFSAEQFEIGVRADLVGTHPGAVARIERLTRE